MPNIGQVFLVGLLFVVVLAVGMSAMLLVAVLVVDELRYRYSSNRRQR